MSTISQLLQFPPNLSRYSSTVERLEVGLGTDLESDDSVVGLVGRFGDAASNILLDPACRHFRCPGLTGVIGYKRYGRYVVALGDPLCAPEDRERLLNAFERSLKGHGLGRIHAVAGPWLAESVLAKGGGIIEFGLDQILNGQIAQSKDGYHRDLRKKLKRARRAGMEIREYRPQTETDSHLERKLSDLARRWLLHRKGPQVFWAGIDLFQARDIRRWFYGTVGGQIVAVLATLKLDSMGGHLFEHILCLPEAPVGASELMITGALETLCAEGSRQVSFGPAPGHALGQVLGFPKLTEKLARSIYQLSNRMFSLDAKVLYRQKFRPAESQARYLAFDPPSINPASLYALLRSFNLSLPVKQRLGAQ